MSKVGAASSGESMFKQYRILFFAIIVLALGISMIIISALVLTPSLPCVGSTQKNFFPGTVITATCPVPEGSLGQDITFNAYFYSTAGNVAGGETIQIPAHLQIRGPHNEVLRESDFNDRMSLSIKAESPGTYTATVTNLQTDYDPVWKQTTVIVYSFGSFTSASASTFGAVGAVGNLILIFGILFSIVSAVKLAMKRKNSLIS